MRFGCRAHALIGTVRLAGTVQINSVHKRVHSVLLDAREAKGEKRMTWEERRRRRRRGGR